ncbi:Gldg family protein [Sphingobium phenoxybenzoativorans]|uniref:Gldg family protein n=1 Tax=Sphingobium phenoxybenzoativorans TaxID=1592790 RepID=UPI0008728F13|nr:hypothetical protein [Sphingobium phenoxybenzoativorans]
MRSAAWSGATIFLAILASLIGGLALGGPLSTGQADPFFWVKAQAICMMALAALVRWRRKQGSGAPVFPWQMCAGAGSLSAIALFCGVSASTLLLSAMLGLLAITVLALSAIWFLPRLKGFACLLLLIGGVAGADMWVNRPAPKSPSRPELAILSALPIFGPAGALMGKHAPLIDRLALDFTIRPVDSLTAAPLRQGERLLVAQPRALPPADLAFIDAWVRGGGTAVILADPLLLWPMALPPGDRRRPPVTSLLDPLLSHWGLELLPSEGREVERRFLSGGALLPIAGASSFKTTGSCRLAEQGLFALCRIGKGKVRLIADADMADDRLWLADPDHPLSPASLSGDTPGLLSDWLRDPMSSRPIPPSRPWIGNDAAMIAAMRWALLAGMAWAILGAGVVFVREKPGRHGK